MGYLIYQTIYSSRRPLSLLYSVFLWIISIFLSSIPSLVRSLCSDLYIRCLRTRSIPSFRVYLVCSCLSVHSPFFPSLWFVSCVSSLCKCMFYSVVFTWSFPIPLFISYSRFFLGLFRLFLFLILLKTCSIPSSRFYLICSCLSVSLPVSSLVRSVCFYFYLLFLKTCSIPSFSVYLFYSHPSVHNPLHSLPWLVPYVSTSIFLC